MKLSEFYVTLSQRERQVFTLVCQECGREVPGESALWGQEYPNHPGSPAVPFCNQRHRARYIRDFKAEKAKFLRNLGIG